MHNVLKPKRNQHETRPVQKTQHVHWALPPKVPSLKVSTKKGRPPLIDVWMGFDPTPLDHSKCLEIPQALAHLGHLLESKGRVGLLLAHGLLSDAPWVDFEGIEGASQGHLASGESF